MPRRLPALLCLFLLGACAGPHHDGGKLAESAWHFVTIDGDPPAAGRATIAFEGERIGANLGCNGMAGPWRVESGRLIAGPLAQTRMACDDAIGEQERAVAALLAGAPRIRLEHDRLVLKSSGHSAELQRAS